MPHNIHKDLVPLAAPVERLTPLDRNARQGDVDAIAASYKQFGQRKPLVARVTGGTDAEPTGQISAGNHQFLAAKQLGWTEVAVVWEDEPEEVARAFALADNRVSELGSTDEQVLIENLQQILEADADLLVSTGYNDAEIDKLLNPPEEDVGPQLTELVYRLVITVPTEERQAEVMAQLDEVGIEYEVQVL